MPTAFDGQIFQQVGKYARGAVLYAFERVGGPDALAEWAVQNPDDFYTKLFPKIIARESEVHHSRGLDELMDVIDGDYDIDDPVGETEESDDDSYTRADDAECALEFDGSDYVEFDD